MFATVKQIVVFHLAIAGAILATLIPGLDGNPSDLDKASYHLIASRGKEDLRLQWLGENLLETLPAKETDPPKILSVRFSEDTASTFQNSPPSPVDYAVVLYEINQYGARHIAISDPLFWENDGKGSPMRQLGFASLVQEMSSFDRVLLGTPVDRSVRTETPPAVLNASALPKEQIQGDISALPAANQLPFDFPDELPKQARLTPTYIDGQPEFIKEDDGKFRLPLLVRWGDSVIPSFVLGLAIDLVDVSVQDISVELGSHIQIGTDRQILIDEFGYTTIELDKTDAPIGLNASALLLAEGEDRQPNQSIFSQAELVLVLQTDQAPGPLQPDDEQPYTHRGDLLAHAASYLVNNSSITQVATLTPAASWINWLILANVSLICAFIYGFRAMRAFGYLLLFICLFAILCFLALSSGLWTPVAPPVAAAITSILAIPLLSWWKEATAFENSENTESDDKSDCDPELVELDPEDV